ncbi:hypothetical protein BKA56DRAFT_608107 [Ilyonectria sp. MPI-CAGE-AT-0026]|nr:hypothetical protein BKA56DRAFT_608107 [Ilyonectria sp. MPI-CAGE-AT-0026]
MLLTSAVTAAATTVATPPVATPPVATPAVACICRLPRLPLYFGADSTISHLSFRHSSIPTPQQDRPGTRHMPLQSSARGKVDHHTAREESSRRVKKDQALQSPSILARAPTG